MSTSDEPSPIMLAHRIRNHLISYFKITSSYEEQREYERNVPIAHVPSEIIEIWNVHVHHSDPGWFTEPVFSLSEQAAIREFDAIWNRVADDIRWSELESLPELSDLIGTEPWERLRQAAEVALGVFHVRGAFYEEEDAFPD